MRDLRLSWTRWMGSFRGRALGEDWESWFNVPGQPGPETPASGKRDNC